MEEKCIFCKIVNGEIPSAMLWENGKFLAILDIFPNTEGMTLVIPKKHFDSDVFKMPDEDYLDLMQASKKIVGFIKKGLKVKRVAMICEGMGVNHMHVKLYPLHGLKDYFQEMWPEKKVYFNKYEGYLTTLLGPEKSSEELEEIAKKIRKTIN